MQIHIDDRQQLPIDHESLRHLVKSTLNQVACHEVDEMTLYLVDNQEIKNLHQQFFQDPSPTDCISFPMDRTREQGYCYLGDLFISIEEALFYCHHHPEQRLEEEIALYVIHGILHLIGYDDIAPEDRIVMRYKERSLLSLLAPSLLTQLVKA